MSYIEEFSDASLITDKSCGAGKLRSVFDIFIDEKSRAWTYNYSSSDRSENNFPPLFVRIRVLV